MPGDDQDVDKAVVDWLIAVTGNEELVLAHYDEMDVDTVERLGYRVGESLCELLWTDKQNPNPTLIKGRRTCNQFGATFYNRSRSASIGKGN